MKATENDKVAFVLLVDLKKDIPMSYDTVNRGLFNTSMTMVVSRAIP